MPTSIIGMELTDFWGTVESAGSTTATTAIGINETRIKPDTKSISINSVELNTKSNYQDFQRFQAVDIAMAADAEATLPALIEAVKAAIPADRKAAIEKRGEALTEGQAEARERTRRRRRSPGTRARSAPRGSPSEIWAQIKDQDWSLVAQSGNISGWPHAAVADGASTIIGSAAPAAPAWAMAPPAAVGAALANREHRPLLGVDPGRRRPDVRAGRAVDRGAAQNPAADRDAQQPRLPSGSDARAAAVELPQPRGESRQDMGPIGTAS